MTTPAAPSSILSRIRALLLIVLAVGMCGIGAELIAFEHFEDAWQAAPVGLIAVALAAVLWNAVAPTTVSIRLLQVLMLSFIAAGLAGIYLHYQGNLAFQLEIDPTQSRWDLFTKVLHAKAPPSLAPGSMAQLGLLGLIWAYRHPALTRSSVGHTTGART